MEFESMNMGEKRLVFSYLSGSVVMCRRYMER